MSHDILSDVLRNVRLRGALFYHVSGGRNWAAEAPPSRDIATAVMPDSEHVMEYHVVIGGSCWGAIVGEPPVRLDTDQMKRVLINLVDNAIEAMGRSGEIVVDLGLVEV